MLFRSQIDRHIDTSVKDRSYVEGSEEYLLHGGKFVDKLVT